MRISGGAQLQSEEAHDEGETTGQPIREAKSKSKRYRRDLEQRSRRQALELHMKAVISEGGNFLASPTDHITLYKTHSLRWLAQIVCQIIKRVGWESQFNCEGVSTVAEFSSLVNQLEALEPVSCAVHADKRGRPGAIPAQLHRSEVAELFPKLDALVDLLAATADALAATWDQKGEAETHIVLNPTALRKFS